MSNFDWHSEEDAGWEAELERPRPEKPRGRRPWLTMLLLLAILGGVGWLGYRQIQAQIEAQTRIVEADVLASHELVLAATAVNDSELLRAVLSGRDDEWVTVQEALAAGGAWLDRGGLALRLQADAVSAPRVVLAPDFNAAEVTFARAYAVNGVDGVTETVVLTQTAVYRRGSQRWLLAPPDTDFWGTLNSSRGRYVTLHFWDRDEAWGERLANDLERTVIELCLHVDGVTCEDDLHLVVRLERDAAALRLLLDPTYAWQRRDLFLDLPALTLLGMPADEAAYQAVFQAYARQVAAAVLTHLADYECCENAPFYRALLDYQLSQIGLATWPVTGVDYARLFIEKPDLGTFIPRWRDTDLQLLADEDGWLVYAMVDFMLRAGHAQFAQAADTRKTALALQAGMAPGQSFISWLDGQFPAAGGRTLTASLDALSREMWQYAYAQTLMTDRVAERPFPDADVALLCVAEDSDDMQVYQVALPLGEGEMPAAFELPGFAYGLNRLSDGDGLFFSLANFDGDVWQVGRWRDGAARILASSSGLFVSLGQINPAGTRIVMFTAEDPQGEEIELALLDPTQCDGETCALLPLAGMPAWAPDGQHSMLAAFSTEDLFQTALPYRDRWGMLDQLAAPLTGLETELWLADGNGQLLDPAPEGWAGYAPFWVDDETFGFVRFDAAGAPEVVLGEVGRVAVETAVTLADLLPHLPPAQADPRELAIYYVATHPAQPRQLFVVLLDTMTQQALVTRVDLQSGDVTLLLQSSYAGGHALGFSPDGRWLLLAGATVNDLPAQQPAGVSETLLYRLADGVTRRYLQDSPIYFFGFSGFDWSAGGDWLLLNLGQNIPLALIAPDDDYVYVPPLDLRQCLSSVWMAP